jgi:pyruvate/2-oxoglutarate dehydrogenase complex dihydrolipoamide dehydrogenase (E3) component
MRTFDAIIIGAGQAGPSLAGSLTGAGLAVAFAERHLFGGTCVNTGCMPTKTLVASAYAAHLARRAAEFGVVIEGEVRIDIKTAMARAHTVSENSRKGVEKYLREMKGCTVFDGHARFESQKTVRVGEQLLQADRVFINVGGRAFVPDLKGVDTVPYLTNSTLLALNELPEHLVVVGGSYVGLEFAQIYRRFGSRVTVIEKGPRVVSREDEDVSQAMHDILEDEGINIRTSAECITLSRHEHGVAVGVDCLEGEPLAIGSHVLLAVGRRPNTDDLGLDLAGVQTDARGYISVNDRLETNVPGIWAIGECNGHGAFTHTAYNDYEIVRDNLLQGQTRGLSQRISAYALFTDPPLGRVGLSEHEARASGRPLLMATRPMSRVGRAIEKAETKGFMKAIVDAETRKILGASILGTGGDEAIHGVIDLMQADVPYDLLIRAVPIHPTVSELIPTLLGSLKAAT